MCKREAPIVEFVRSVRREDPGLGQRKLWLMSGAVFGEQMLGRDAFYALLAREGLKLKRPKPRHTTNSNHRFHKWKNLVKGYVARFGTPSLSATFPVYKAIPS